eukprot:c12951_g1_i2.p1 GENE.c12951_g1_i2~~c12951_g1_i2.p1  ORF type:complete len:175 (+),score=48.57 c12951_g1_i2:331-855(+)
MSLMCSWTKLFDLWHLRYLSSTVSKHRVSSSSSPPSLLAHCLVTIPTSTSSPWLTHTNPATHNNHNNNNNNEEDDVPLDEFGLKKDCHWIQMDFTQHSDKCNQCMTVADAFFRGEDMCVCYRDKPGSLLRTSCKEIKTKFEESEDHIRELAVENQWNEYYKSYGLCENFGHCGA